MKVSINAGGREVTIECHDANVTAEGVGKIAMDLWQQTKGADERLGPPYGFAAQERAPGPSMWPRAVDFGLEPLKVTGEATR